MPRPSSASPASKAALPKFSPAFAPPAPPASRRSKSTACCCAASTTTRSKALPASPAKKMSSSASSSSCLSKKAASGRPRSSSRCAKSSTASAAILPLVELPPREASETARRYTFADGVGEIGIIAPVSQAFCGACSRVRLTSDGKIRTCLFSQVEHDLYGRLRAGAGDEELAHLHRPHRLQKGSPPPHRRAGIPEALPVHGPHRRLTAGPHRRIIGHADNRTRQGERIAHEL